MTTYRMFRCNLCSDYLRPSDSAAKEGFGVHFVVGSAAVFKRVTETEKHICYQCAKSVHDAWRLTTPAARAADKAWVPAHERVPAPGTECVVLVRYTLDRPPFCTVDKWDVQREDPTGMGGPTIETGEGWNDNYECDVIAWIAIPPHPPAEWDQRLPA